MAKTKQTKSSLNSSAKSRSDDLKDYSALKTVLFYSMLIVFLPMIAFFTSQNFIFNKLNIDPVWSNIYSAICTVVTLHVALFIYVYRAYFGGARSDDDTKED